MREHLSNLLGRVLITSFGAVGVMSVRRDRDRDDRAIVRGSIHAKPHCEQADPKSQLER